MTDHDAPVFVCLGCRKRVGAGTGPVELKGLDGNRELISPEDALKRLTF
jgi:hypothetical protein